MRLPAVPVGRILTVFAIAAMPTLAFAQTPAAQPNPAADALKAARASLNKVLNAPAPSGEAFAKLSQIKTEYIALEKSASTASPEWQTHQATIEKLLSDLIGAPTAAAEAGAVGTSGQTGARPLDPAIASNLSEFRTHLTAFSAAMGKVRAPSTTTAAAAPAAAATPPAAAAPLTAPASPVSAAAVPAAAATAAAPPATSTAASVAAPASAAADPSIASQLDPVIALLEATLGANAADSGGKVTVDRAALEQMKTRLEQIRQRARQP